MDKDERGTMKRKANANGRHCDPFFRDLRNDDDDEDGDEEEDEVDCAAERKTTTK